MKEKELGKLNKIGRNIFLTWFAVSIIAMFVFSGLNMPHLTLILFGQYFIVFGCLILFQKETPAPGIICFTVGLSTIMGTIIAKNYDRLKIITTDVSDKFEMTFILATIVFILSIVFLIIHLINKKTYNYFYIFLTLLIIFILLAFYLCF